MDNVAILMISSYGLFISLIDYHASKEVDKEVNIFTFIIGTFSFAGYLYSIFMFFINTETHIITSALLVLALGVIGPYYIYNKRIGKF